MIVKASAEGVDDFNLTPDFCVVGEWASEGRVLLPKRQALLLGFDESVVEEYTGKFKEGFLRVHTRWLEVVE